MYIRHYTPPMQEVVEFLNDNPELKEILRETYRPEDRSLAAWAAGEKSPEEKDVPYPDNRVQKTKAGHKVRNKAELMIDQGLYLEKIPFRYEETVTVNGRTLHPDFMIRHPLTGKVVLWEHCGRMDEEDYIEMTVRKLRDYAQAGYLPGRDLIMTFETKDQPLLSEEIFAIIEKYFK